MTLTKALQTTISVLAFIVTLSSVSAESLSRNTIYGDRTNALSTQDGVMSKPVHTKNSKHQESTSSSPILQRILNSGKLVVATSGDMPGMSLEINRSREKNSLNYRNCEIMGLDADLAQAIADQMIMEVNGHKVNVEPQFKCLKFSELIDAVRCSEDVILAKKNSTPTPRCFETYNNVDIVISGITITPARNRNMVIVGPYLVTGKCLLTRTDLIKDMELQKSTDYEDIIQSFKFVGAKKNTTSYQKVASACAKNNHCEVRAYDEEGSNAYETAMEDLLACDETNLDNSTAKSCKIHAFVADYPTCFYYMHEHSDNRIVSLLSLTNDERIGIAIPPSDPIFKNILENILDKLKKTGELKRMKERWLYSSEWIENYRKYTNKEYENENEKEKDSLPY